MLTQQLSSFNMSFYSEQRSKVHSPLHVNKKTDKNSEIQTTFVVVIKS